MAQVRSEPNFGRCILTPQPPRQRATAKRTGNMFPVGHEPNNTSATSVDKLLHAVATEVPVRNRGSINHGNTTTTPSTATSNDTPTHVAPMAKMESSQKRRDREAAVARSGKGKGRATSPVSRKTSSTTTPGGNGGASGKTELLLTSDILPDPQQLDKRYQEEVDRLESQRDREDTDFSYPGTQEDSQTQELNNSYDTPRRRSRIAARDSETDMRSLQMDSAQRKSTQPAQPAQPKAARQTPAKQIQLPVQQKPQQVPVQHTPAQQPAVQQTLPAQQPPIQQVRPARQQQQQQPLPQSRKRKADTENAPQHPRLSPSARSAISPITPNAPTREVQPDHKPMISGRHNNRRFELCKPESQTRREDAVKAIKKLWRITDDRLMELPFAPRLMYERGQPIMRPLDWNTKLLQTLVQLANMTKGNFPKACVIAEDAFEKLGRPCGAKQLTDKILLTRLSPQHPESGNVQASASATSVEQPASDCHRGAPISASNGKPAIAGRQSPDEIVVSRQLRTRPSLVVKLPMGRQDQPLPASSETSPAAAYPSPPARPIKSEHVVPIMQQEDLNHDDGDSSGSEERLHLESKQKILKHKLAIVKEEMAIEIRNRKWRERKAAKARQPGASVDTALLV
jgi:hypothetical protein